MATPADRRHEAQPVTIVAGPSTLTGDLAIPAEPRCVVVVADRSDSSLYVAAGLRAGGFATLLLDLLPEEDATERGTRHASADVGSVAARIVAAVDWVERNESTR